MNDLGVLSYRRKKSVGAGVRTAWRGVVRENAAWLQGEDEGADRGWVGGAQAGEGGGSRGALAGVEADGLGDGGRPAVMQELVADAGAPQRRGAHAAGDRDRVAVVANVVAERAHVVDEEVREG